jgi:hypothetical protein
MIGAELDFIFESVVGEGSGVPSGDEFTATV